MKTFKKLLMASLLALTLTGCQLSSDRPSSLTSIETKTEAPSKNTTQKTNEKPSINVKKIWNRYNADPDKHTPTYSGKSETATGTITYIGKDDHGTDSMQLSDKKSGTSYVLGVFDSAKAMSAVSVGDTVTITGNFHIMSSKNMVVLKECKIKKIYQ